MTIVERNINPLDARYYDEPLPTLPDARAQGMARISQMLEEER